MTRRRGASDADSSRAPDLIFARVVRQFERGRGDVFALERYFHLAAAPTVGDRLELAGVADRLAVVAVTMRPRPTGPGAVPPDVDLFCEYEPLAVAEQATAHGWQEPTASTSGGFAEDT